MLYLRVKTPFKWLAELPKLEAGDVFEIPERHPRLDAMVRGRFVYHDQSKTQDELAAEYSVQLAKSKPSVPIVVK